jgi:hypothetical protein
MFFFIFKPSYHKKNAFYYPDSKRAQAAVKIDGFCQGCKNDCKYYVKIERPQTDGENFVVATIKRTGDHSNHPKYPKQLRGKARKEVFDKLVNEHHGSAKTNYKF